MYDRCLCCIIIIIFIKDVNLFSWMLFNFDKLILNTEVRSCSYKFSYYNVWLKLTSLWAFVFCWLVFNFGVFTVGKKNTMKRQNRFGKRKTITKLVELSLYLAPMVYDRHSRIEVLRLSVGLRFCLSHT
jgi:hypothetical protein